MDRNSQANEFTGVAGFLCGLDDEPPISGPAAAAAFLQHGLDNDPAFQFGRPPGLQPTSWQELARAYPPNTRDQRVSSQESSQRELEVHCETEENGNKVDQIERFMINLEGELRVPDGFFTKLRQRFHLTPDAPTELTWRFFDDAKKTRNRLQTNEDAQQALERCKAAFRSRQRQKPVHLYVKAQIQPKPANDESKKSKEPTASETACVEEMRMLKAKLLCQHHSAGRSSGDSAYCYVKPSGPKAGEHTPATLGIISLWARLIREGKADPDGARPPNVLGLDNVENQAGPSHEPTRRRNHNSGVHVDVHLDELKGLFRPFVGKRKRSPSLEILDDVRERENQPISRPDFSTMAIADFLNHLHGKWPLYDFPQYLAKLEKHHVLYAINVADFEKEFYEQEVGMPRTAFANMLRELGYAVETLYALKRPRRSPPLSPSKRRNH